MKQIRWMTCLGMTVLAIAAGCESGGRRGAPGALGAGVDIPPLKDAEMTYSAFQSAAEQEEAAKADNLYMPQSYAEVYGFTDAPPSGSRGMAEWERADGVVVSWKRFSKDFLQDLIYQLQKSTDVYLLTQDEEETEYLEDKFRDWRLDDRRTRYLEYDRESVWTRDYGPGMIEMPDGRKAFVDWRYYANRHRDDAVPTLLARYLRANVYRPNIFTEGGNFMTNGQGLCAMTTWVVQENPELGEQGVIDVMKRYFGCEEVAIFQRMAGEGTGHIDMFAKFTQPDTVLVGKFDARDDRLGNAKLLDDHAARFASLKTRDGKPLRVVRIPMPAPEENQYRDGWIFRSFTNSLILNKTVIVPVYDELGDRDLEDAATAAYRDAMPPDTQILKVDSSQIIYDGGAVHCTTMSFTYR